MPTTPTTGKPGIRLLSEAPLFSGLSQRQLRVLVDLSQEVNYNAGRVIVKKGAPGVAFYVIVEGTAKVVPGKIVGSLPIVRLGPGEFFGEMALLDGEPRMATVVAETPLQTIRITRTPFLRMLRSEPEIGIKILATMARRMRVLSRSPAY